VPKKEQAQEKGEETKEGARGRFFRVVLGFLSLQLLLFMV